VKRLSTRLDYGLLFALLSVLALALTTGCIGDPGRVQTVNVHNATTEAVLIRGVYETVTEIPDVRLAPGQTVSTGWFIPPGVTKRHTVRAFDQSGNLIFCNEYSSRVEEAHEVVVSIEITKGQLLCH
jgi:hypothetical protein